MNRKRTKTTALKTALTSIFFTADQSGTATVEETVILVTVAVGFGLALTTAGPLLLSCHSAIEFVLSLPVP
jgi:Flp pilus assembly pilin Flp